MSTPTKHTHKARKSRRITCKSCYGSGRIDDHENPVRRCDDCMGSGYYYTKARAALAKSSGQGVTP